MTADTDTLADLFRDDLIADLDERRVVPVIDAGSLLVGEGVERMPLDSLLVARLADRYGATEVAGSNSLWQRSKRLVFRLPHDASGAELAQRAGDARARKP